MHGVLVRIFPCENGVCVYILQPFRTVKSDCHSAFRILEELGFVIIALATARCSVPKRPD